MTPGRIRALVALAVAIAAGLGIALPGGGDGGSSSTTVHAVPSTTVARTTNPTTSTPASRSSSAAIPSSAPHAGPDPSSEEGQAVARVLAEIDSGQSSQYSQDGTTFENREGLLPEKSYGYYREYTVLTPNSSDRGARRLVRGEQGELYYTNDHYTSFTPIDPDRYR